MGEDEKKRCRLCGALKPLAEFYTAHECIDGHRGECRTCFQAQALARAEANPALREIARERARKWLEDNPERKRAYNRAYAEAGKKGASDRRSHLKRHFGITPEDYNRMLAEQGGGCAVCGDPPGATALHVDHCHDSGRVRGLLCFRCNSALGNLRDDPTIVMAEWCYLTRHTEGSR
jgi:hypothetical protein